MNVKVGDTAPDFSLTDQDGREWVLSEQRPAPVVLFFYPKDNTPGCTAQACDVRDRWAEFRQLGVGVAGISPDGVGSHERFAGRLSLPYRLLADPERRVIDAYGAWGEKKMLGKTYEGVIRSSVVIDGDGVVAAVFDRIKPVEQSDRTLAAVRELTG